MINLAGREQAEADRVCTEELTAAGIAVHSLSWMRQGEVTTSIFGSLDPAGWGFKRSWYYWRADGPGIPPEDAEELHEKHGRVVRVAGHCGCPSPTEWYKGFAVGDYHVDTAEGLKALADLIKKILARNGLGTPPSIYSGCEHDYRPCRRGIECRLCGAIFTHDDAHHAATGE